MKFFLLAEKIEDLAALPPSFLFDGVVLGQRLADLHQPELVKLLETAAAQAAGPLFMTLSLGHDQIELGYQLAAIAPNIAVCLMMSFESLSVCKALSDGGHMVCLWDCKDPAQAMLAAKSGATYVALKDTGPAQTQRTLFETRILFDRLGFKTNIIAPNVLDGQVLTRMAKAGAHAICLKPEQIQDMCREEELANSYIQPTPDLCHPEMQFGNVT